MAASKSWSRVPLLQPSQAGNTPSIAVEHCPPRAMFRAAAAEDADGVGFDEGGSTHK
jgi:hypothetical protein